jgi:hypothetical protein
MKRIEKKMKKTTVKADRVKGRKEGRTMGILGKLEKEKEIKRNWAWTQFLWTPKAHCPIC